jgi:hypothetical protein
MKSNRAHGDTLPTCSLSKNPGLMFRARGIRHLLNFGQRIDFD